MRLAPWKWFAQRRNSRARLERGHRLGGRRVFALCRNWCPEFFQFGARALVLVGLGIALDYFAEFFDSGLLLAHSDQRKSFFQVRRGELETLRVVGEDFVVFRHGLLVLLLGEGDLAEVKLRVRGEIRVAVILQIVLKLRARQVVFSAGDVAQPV